MADLFSGGAVGAVLQEVLKAGLQIIDKGRDFKPTLESNIDTLQALAPLVEEIKRYSNELDRPSEEIEGLESEMRAGEELVRKCSKFRWWRFPSFPRYREKLRARDKSLKRHLSVNLQPQMARDMMETLSKVRRILEILSNNYAGLGNDVQGKQIRGLSGAPEEPEFTVGLDEPLKNLKIELLKGGASVLVLTGLGGSGKSTLAKKLCWDPQIKDRFGVNIFFITVSKTPILKTIVQTLFEHCGYPVSQFQSDEDAVNRLGLLLRQFVGSPILLVLDDVWRGSEALVEKFKFQISDYKILVTSRVAFPRFGTPCQLKSLDHDDAISLFRHFAQLNVSPYMPDENLVQEIVSSCKGSPLVLKVIGGSLCHQPFEVWQNMKVQLQSQSVLESNTGLLSHLQNSLDILEDESSIKEKECFMDLGLFPEDQRIRVPALIDMWAELHDLDEDGMKAMTIIHNLCTRNLVNVIVTRKAAMDTDMYYNNHFLTQHDLLRELAIHQSSQEPFEQRKRLIIELSGSNRPEWWLAGNQQGVVARILSFFPVRGIKQKQKQVLARTLCISTDETFTSDWCNMQPDEAEVLVLNLHSSKYTLPEFMEKMSKLKVVIVTNYDFHLSELNKFELLGSLPNLKRIRLEKVSVPCLCELKNLQKLSLHMCNTKQVFESRTIQISDALPNLVEMNIDYCNDLVELPSGLCKITSLKKLSITNCHKLSVLPQEIGMLKNLEVLRLSSCSDLLVIPESVGRLHKLSCLDISECMSLTQLPENIGDLRSLEKLYMWGCSRLSELPSSVMNFEHIKHRIYVVCDEEGAALWEYFTSIPNLMIEMSKADISLNWLTGFRS